jgi:hypothetical protein
MKFLKNVPIPKRGDKISNEETQRRNTEIQGILVMMEVGECAEISTNNANAWYVSFLNAKEKLAKDKEFTRRKGRADGDTSDPKIYTVWRVK